MTYATQIMAMPYKNNLRDKKGNIFALHLYNGSRDVFEHETNAANSISVSLECVNNETNTFAVHLTEWRGGVFIKKDGFSCAGWDVFDTLTEARKFFRKTVREIKASLKGSPPQQNTCRHTTLA